jgi:twitching motility protein PilT
MGIRFNDQEAEAFVLKHNLLTSETLAPFRLEASVGDSGTLFDILVAAKVLTPELLAEAERSAVPRAPSVSQSLRSIVSHVAAPPNPAHRRSTRMSFDGPAQSPSQSSMHATIVSPPAPTQEDTSHASVHASSTAHGTSVPPPVPAPVLGDISRAASFHASSTAPALASSAATQMLVRARQAGASDLYFCSGRPASMRICGKLQSLDSTSLQPAQVESLVQQLLTPEQWKQFVANGDLEAACSFEGKRYRASLFRHRNGCDAAFRVIPERIQTFKELGLPETCERLAQFPSGLVLVAGGRGSGKTATMMALVDIVNQARQGSIITLESPIEHVLPPRNCLITQREVGSHTRDFSAAFHSALSEDPDIIVIGELSSPEITEVALSAAECGHLVFSTIQAPDCARAIDRMSETHGDSARIRNLAADNLCGILAQQLVVRKDGQARSVVCELLINSISVGNIIREAKTQSLVNVMQMGRQQGMIMMDDSIKALLDAEVISGEQAWRYAKNKSLFKEHAPGQDNPADAVKAADPSKVSKPARTEPPRPMNTMRK